MAKPLGEKRGPKGADDAGRAEAAALRVSLTHEHGSCTALTNLVGPNQKDYVRVHGLG